jgi:hypothetical protein
MVEPIQKATEEFQKVSKDNYDAVLRSYGELNKGFQAWSNRSFWHDPDAYLIPALQSLC